MIEESKRVFNLSAALGADPGRSFQKISIYLPNKDRNNVAVPNLDVWVESGMQILADIATGVTQLPTCSGRFKIVERNPVTHEIQSVRYTVEDTTILYSYVFDKVEFEARFDEIRSFLHDFGQTTNQDSVMVEYTGEGPDGMAYTRAYYISNYVTDSGQKAAERD